MNHATKIVRLAVIALSSLTFAAGCAGPKATDPQRGYSNFKPPKMPPVPPRVDVPIDAQLQVKALEEIAAASRSNNEVMRAQALEALSRTQDANPEDRIARGLADPAWIVRFAAAMAAGDLKHKPAYKMLLAVAYDPEPNVRVAARYALHRLGDKTLTKDLEALSKNPDPRVRANVALAIGQLGEPTGTRVVRPLLSDSEFTVRIQAAEALWRLGDEQGLKNLVAGSISRYPDDVIISILALAAPRDQRVKDNVIGKLAEEKDGQQHVELQLAAARAVGMLGGDEGYGVALKSMASQDPRQRALAALALGEIGRTDAQAALGKALADPMPEVRLSAAVALRQLDLRARGVRSMASN